MKKTFASSVMTEELSPCATWSEQFSIFASGVRTQIFLERNNVVPSMNSFQSVQCKMIQWLPSSDNRIRLFETRWMLMTLRISLTCSMICVDLVACTIPLFHYSTIPLFRYSKEAILIFCPLFFNQFSIHLCDKFNRKVTVQQKGKLNLVTLWFQPSRSWLQSEELLMAEWGWVMAVRRFYIFLSCWRLLHGNHTFTYLYPLSLPHICSQRGTWFCDKAIESKTKERDARSDKLTVMSGSLMVCHLTKDSCLFLYHASFIQTELFVLQDERAESGPVLRNLVGEGFWSFLRDW